METALEANLPVWCGLRKMPQENGELSRLPRFLMGPLISEASKDRHLWGGLELVEDSRSAHHVLFWALAYSLPSSSAAPPPHQPCGLELGSF